MAEGDGVLGDGAELWLTNEAGTLTKLKGLLNVNRPTLAIGKVETTDHDSNKTKTYIPGHGDVGELAATLKYEPGSSTDLLILEHLASREKRPFMIVTPEEDGSKQEHEGSMFLMTYAPDNAPLGGVRNATLTGQPSAAPVQAAAAP
jgi:hypothetical protein